jgi:hypothetical protein
VMLAKPVQILMPRAFMPISVGDHQCCSQG